jgi:hypothetical protein
LVGELGGDAAAERVPDDGHPVDAEHVEQVAHAVGVGGDAVVGPGLGRGAVAEQVGFHEGYAVTEHPGVQAGIQVDLTPLGAARVRRRAHRPVGLGGRLAVTARVLRFRRTAELLGAAGPASSIADVAAAGGAADHGHLVRELHRLAGCTPSEYLAG